VDALQKAGVDQVLIYSVNDGAVMDAWAADQQVSSSSSSSTTTMITLMGDPTGYVTKMLDMELTHPGPQSVGLINRCKRFALYIVDGVVQIVRVAESNNDPAGDDFPDVTLAEAMVKAITEYNNNHNNNKRSENEEL
jgi:peroxiredoxin